MAANDEALTDLHEKNSGKLEKPCFAGNTLCSYFSTTTASSEARVEKAEQKKMSADPAALTGRTMLQRGAWLIPSILTRLSTTIDVWIERSRQRHALGEMARNDHLLADIGLSFEQARREARKPFWVFSKDGTPHDRPNKGNGHRFGPKGRRKLDSSCAYDSAERSS